MRKTVFAWWPVQVYRLDRGHATGGYLVPIGIAWLRRVVRVTTVWGDTVHVEQRPN